MTSDTAGRLAALSEPQRRLLELRLASQATEVAEIPVLPGGPAVRPGPLSFPQQRLWFLQQMDPGSTAYNLQWAIRMGGPLDVAALERCLSEIAGRHEILRTTFAWRGAELVQVVAPMAAVPLQVEDLRALAPDEQSDRARERSRNRARRPFDLATGPLVQVDLLHLGEARHLLLVTLHHILADGWSHGVFLHELAVLYEAFKGGRPSPLEPLPIQYRDFAAWQRRWLRGQRLEEPLDYWRQRLDGLPALRLPSDRSGPGSDPRGVAPAGAVKLALPAELVVSLQALGKELGATLFMVLLAGLEAVLGTYSGQTDFAVGTPIANRRRAELEGLIGFFANTLVLRAELAGDPTFAELVRRTRTVCLEAYEHQDLPFERLVEELRPARNLSQHPLFQVMLTLHNEPPGRLELAGLNLALEDAEVSESRFDVELMLTGDGAEGLAGWLFYREDSFDRALVERLAGSFRRLIEDAVAHPRRRLSELALLDPGERTRLLGAWSDGPRSPVSRRCLHELVEEQAAAHPTAPAVTCGDETLSYRELERRANVLARRLRGLGVRPETRVAVCLDRSADLVVALVGVLKAGGAYLPLDPTYPLERLSYMLRDSQAAVLLTDTKTNASLDGFDGAVLNVEEIGEGQDGMDMPKAATRPENLAYVIYTSGSTGRPKGVMISHRNLVNLVCAMASELPITNSDVILATTTLSFDIAGLEIWGALTTGACVRIAPNPLSCDWPEFVKLADSQDITTMQGTPSTWRFLLDRGWTPPAARKLLCGGEALPADLARRLQRAGSPLWNLYGPTETTIWSALSRIDQAETVVPLGSPIANTELYVLNRSLEPVPAGVAGELCIGGAGLARGYLAKPGATAASFLPNPFASQPGERLYQTGDLVRRHADGTLQFLGRTDEQLKIRGHRIEPGEIESALRQHPMIAQAAVTTVADPAGMPSLVGYVQPRRPPISEPAARDRVAEQEHLEHWQGDRTPVRADLDTVGWRSSYDGQPIPPAEMTEGANRAAAAAVRQLLPRRVLEIGCRNEMMLLRLAPDCDAYWATDTTVAGLTRLAATIEAAQLPPERVRLLRQSAHDLSGLEAERFDTIVLNSVVQYFPSAGYLAEVLDATLRLLEPGGAIFVGDVRNLELLAAFHLWVHSGSAPPDLPLDQLRRRVADAVAGEEELVLSPGFFATFAQIRGLSAEIRTKTGKADNELTRYRYDVILRAATATEGSHRSRRRLAGVRSRRLATDARRLRLLEELRGGTVGELRRAVEHGGDAPAERVPAQWRWEPARPPVPQDWAARFANQPLRARRSRRLASELRTFLRGRLPDAMVPSRLVVLDQLPLTSNGKVDRQRLPALDWQDLPAPRLYVPPRTPTEESCAQIFANLLGLARVGIEDDFFELGGHSLLSARLAAELEAALEVYVPLQTIFERATVANLASIIDHAKRAAAEAGNTGRDKRLVILPAPQAATLDTVLDPSITPAWPAR